MKKSKGFSLVELIIVIAIMAILVGILAPNLMKNIEKSRYSKDKTMVSDVANAFVNALADPDAYDGLGTVLSGSDDSATTVTKTATQWISAGEKAWQDEIKDNLKVTDKSNGMLDQKFTSKKAGKGTKVGECNVTLGSNSGVVVETPNKNIKVEK